MKLTREEIDKLLERYDQTYAALQREIVAAMTMELLIANRRLAIAEEALEEYANRENWGPYATEWRQPCLGYEPAARARAEMEAINGR